MSTELRNTFQEIANAIRTKSGTTEPISARNFASSILSLNAGSSSAEWSFVNGEHIEDSTLPMGIGIRISAEDFAALASSALHGIMTEGIPFLPTQSIVNTAMMPDEPEMSPASPVPWYPYEFVMSLGGWEGPSAVMKTGDYIVTLHHFEESGAAIYALELRMSANTADNGLAVHLIPCQLLNDDSEFLPKGTFVGLISPRPNVDLIENQPIILMPIEPAEIEEMKMMMQYYGFDTIPFGLVDTFSVAYPTSNYYHEMEQNPTEWFPCIELAQEMESSELANAFYSENENVLDFQLEGYQDSWADDYLRLQFKGRIQNFEYTLIGKPVYVLYDGSVSETSTYALFIDSVEEIVSEDALPSVISIYQIEGHTSEQVTQCLVILPSMPTPIIVSPNYYRPVTIYTNGSDASSENPETKTVAVYFWEGTTNFGDGVIPFPRTVRVPYFLIDEEWHAYDEELVVSSTDRDLIETMSEYSVHKQNEVLAPRPTEDTQGQANHYTDEDLWIEGFTLVDTEHSFKERYSAPNHNTIQYRADTNYFNPLKLIITEINEDGFNYHRFQEPADNHTNLLQMKTVRHDFITSEYNWVHTWRARHGQYLYSFNNTTVEDIKSSQDLTLSPNIYRLDLITKEITCMQATMPENLTCTADPIVYDNKFYLLGTYTASTNPVVDSTPLTYNNVIYVYDPVADIFTVSDIVMPEYNVSTSRSPYVDLVGSVITFILGGRAEDGDTPASVIKIDLATKTTKRYTLLTKGESTQYVDIDGLINNKIITRGEDIFDTTPSYHQNNADTQVLHEIIYNDDDNTCTLNYYLDLSFPTYSASAKFYKDTVNGFVYYGYASATTYSANSKSYLAILGDEHNASFDSSYYRVMATIPLTNLGQIHVYNGKIYITINDIKTNMYGNVTSVQSFMDEYSVDSVFGLKVGLDRDEVQNMIDRAIANALTGDY